MLQRVALADTIALSAGRAARGRRVRRRHDRDRRAAALAVAAGVEPRWHVRDREGDPRRRRLGGGSSDAAAALRLANERLPRAARRRAARRSSPPRSAPTSRSSSPRARNSARATAASSPRSTCRRTTRSSSCFPDGVVKASTGEVYARLRRARRREGLRRARAALPTRSQRCGAATISRALPPNDLASSRSRGGCSRLGAFRADVSGAGPPSTASSPTPERADAAAQALRTQGGRRVSRLPEGRRRGSPCLPYEYERFRCRTSMRLSSRVGCAVDGSRSPAQSRQSRSPRCRGHPALVVRRGGRRGIRGAPHLGRSRSRLARRSQRKPGSRRSRS